MKPSAQAQLSSTLQYGLRIGALGSEFNRLFWALRGGGGGGVGLVFRVLGLELKV